MLLVRFSGVEEASFLKWTAEGGRGKRCLALIAEL